MKTSPNKDADFHVAQETISTAASNNRDAWGLDGEWLDSRLLPAKDKWATAWVEVNRTVIVATG